MSSAARTALPDTATEIDERYFPSGNMQDFERLLRARLPRNDFEFYLRNLKMLNQYSRNKQKVETAVISWEALESTPNWWNPSSDLTTSYLDYDGKTEQYTLVKYENGYVYFKAVAW